MDKHNSNKHYNEFLVLLIAFLIVTTILFLVYLRDHNGLERFCKNNPEECSPVIYPGKVSK